MRCEALALLVAQATVSQDKKVIGESHESKSEGPIEICSGWLLD